MIHIEDRHDCVGCAACAQRCPKECITMVPDGEGFLYPLVDEAVCIRCGLCERGCPVIHTPERHPERSVHACYNKADNVRMTSSSGGMFSLLAEKIIRDGGTVFGGGFGENLRIRHEAVDRVEDLARLRGSKYAQSAMGTCFKEAERLLKAGETVLFSGTPCQIAGLKQFLGKDWPRLYTVDLVCHGVPSPAVHEAYLAAVGEKLGAPVERMSFRDKKTGWKTCSLVFESAKGEWRELKRESPYMLAFLRNMTTRPSFMPCRYNDRHSRADITVADYWGIESLYPDWGDDKGVTLVLVNTEKGEELFGSVSDRAVVREAPYDHAADNNFAVRKSSVPHTRREDFFRRFGKEPLLPLLHELLEEQEKH